MIISSKIIKSESLDLSNITLLSSQVRNQTDILNSDTKRCSVPEFFLERIPALNPSPGSFKHLDRTGKYVIQSPLKDASSVLGVRPVIYDSNRIAYNLVGIFEWMEYSVFPFAVKSRFEADDGSKTFRQYGNWGTNGWRPKLTRRNALPVFRAPIAKLHSGRLIFSEGEKGVFAAMQNGWEKDSTLFSCCLNESRTDIEPLVGKRDVWILPDNDLAGFRRANALSERLPHAYVVDPRGGAGDLADIIEAGWGLHDFHSWMETNILSRNELSRLAGGSDHA